jgi:hypothetical protein
MMENQEQPKPKRRYKKRTKKVTPTQGLLTDASKEIREIPMYDPYTGEANPHYEELTGKPNPLMRPKGFTIDGVADKARKELFGLPIIDKKTDYKSEAEPMDIKTNTRFYVIFPDEMGIKPFQVKSISRPTITRDDKYFMGVKVKSKVRISQIVVDLLDFITDDDKLNVRLNTLFVDKKRFNFSIQSLAPNGSVLESIILGDCTIDGIGFSRLTYGDDNVSTTSLKIQPRKYSIV